MFVSYHAIARCRERYPELFVNLNNQKAIDKAKNLAKYSFRTQMRPDGTYLYKSAGVTFVMKDNTIITCIR